MSGKQAEARALWARSLARSPDSKPLRATIERLTGTKMESAPKPAARRTPKAPDDKTAAPAPEPLPPPTSTGS